MGGSVLGSPHRHMHRNHRGRCCGTGSGTGTGCTSTLLLPATCLKPTYSLRRQLMMSYGCTALLTISICVAVSVFCAVSAGHIVKDESRSMMAGQVLESVQLTSKYAAAAMTERLTLERGKARLLEEMIQDRIVGYPYREYADGSAVPFRDIQTGKNIYPLDIPRELYLQPDWNITLNIDASNVQEHVQERWPLVAAQKYKGSTATAAYYQQGSCNPSAKIQNDGSVPYDYYQLCTTAHNNFSTGGQLHPTSVSDWLSKASADLVPSMKALWESDAHALFLGIYFHNAGAGSTVVFPGLQTNLVDSYVSAGCEWMKQPNPLKPNTTAAIGTNDEIERCHVRGQQVNGREYNPMEREWCQAQALKPNEFHYYGPYRASPDMPLAFSVGKAVYDRMTHNFIACMSIDIGLDNLGEYLKHIDNHTKAALVKPDGTFVSGGEWDPVTASKTLHITETPWMEMSEWETLIHPFEHEHHNYWHEASYQHDHTWGEVEPTILRKKDGSYLTLYPLLQPSSSEPPTVETDGFHKGTIEPIFWMVFYVSGNVFDVFDDIDQAIDSEVSDLIRGSILIGFVGAVVLLVAIWMVTRTLTRPLKWIESVAWKIVNHGHHDNIDSSEAAESANNILGIPTGASFPPWQKHHGIFSKQCVPRTDITELVAEFSRMIQGFSGVGASSVAQSSIHEVPNILRWQADFHYLYQFRQEQQEEEMAMTESQNQNNPYHQGDSVSDKVDSRSVSQDSNSISNSRGGHRSTVGAVRSHSLSHMGNLSRRLSYGANVSLNGDAYRGTHCNASSVCSASHNSLACHWKQPSIRSVMTHESHPDSISAPIMRSTCVVGTSVGASVSDSNSSTGGGGGGGTDPFASSRTGSARSLIDEVYNNSDSHSHSQTPRQEQQQSTPHSVQLHDMETPREENTMEEITTDQLFRPPDTFPLEQARRPTLDLSVSNQHPSMIREESTGHSNTSAAYDEDDDKFDDVTQPYQGGTFSNSNQSKSSVSLPDSSQLSYGSLDQSEEYNEYNVAQNEVQYCEDNDSGPSSFFDIPMIPPPRINHGPNIRTSAFRHYLQNANSDAGGSGGPLSSDNASFSSHHPHEDTGKVKPFKSALFRWTLLLIVIPQVLTTICITALVSYTIINVLPTWVELSEEPSFEAAREGVSIAATQRSFLSESVLVAPLRDLYLVSRFAGWLLFDAIPRSQGFTEYWQNAEECKIYGFIRQQQKCPFYLDPSKTQCDCAWNDAYELPCQDYQAEMESRRFQQAFYLGLARDADPITGRRNETSEFNSRGEEDGPEKTLWWNDTRTMPGSWKGANASGYETTYDRVRVSSALSTVLFPVYNYMNELDIKKYFLLAGVAFEADGLSVGHKGCNFFTNLAHWESTTENRAYQIRPELCPLGRFGFDPRCRDWYDTGRKRALEQDQLVYVTPPYWFAGEELTETTATSPLMDPYTGEHIGQASIDFKLQKIISAITEQTDALFTIMIAPKEDVGSGGDTLIGPNYTTGSAAPRAIVDLVLPYDDEFSENYKNFKGIVALMKEGQYGDAQFTRRNETGTEQLLHIAYAPVFVRSLEPVGADDFTRGVTVSQDLVYSIGVVELVDTLKAPYEDAERTLNAKIKNVEMIFLIAVIFVTTICTAFTGQISLAVTTPTLILLRIVKNINAGRIDDDLPPLEGGSRESNKVYISFAKLFKIVRVSNTAFFSGNLKWAYHFVSDALKLFRKIDDKKAIGVACNNIANILFAMNENSKYKGTSSENKDCSLVDGVCCVAAAPDHFEQAIKIASKDLADAQFLDVKADFAQQLANRHFNRAVFLLKTKNDGCASPYSKEKGYKDLKKAMSLDIDVRDYWFHNNILMEKSDIYFDRLIRRLQGLAYLRDDETVREIWNVRELVSEADQLLFAAWQEEAVPLFREIDRIGRLQQLESALISLELASDNVEEAARLGMRMVIEDEYLIDSAFIIAADAFFRFMNLDESNAPRWSPSAVTQTKSSIREMLKMCKNSTLDTGKCLVFCFALSVDVKSASLTEQVKNKCKSLYKDHCGKDDIVGLVSSTNTVAGLGISTQIIKDKGIAGTVNEDILEAAVDTRCKVPPQEALAAAIQLATDTSDFSEEDTFIIFITDSETSQKDIDAAMMYVRSREDPMNPEIRTLFNVKVIIIGLECHRPLGEISDHENSLRHHPHRSRSSARKSTRGTQFLSAWDGTVDKAFEQASYMITGMVGNARSPHQGITMEKF